MSPDPTGPDVCFTVLPETGPVGTTFLFDATCTADGDETLQYEWDFDDDGTIDDDGPTLNVISTHEYPAEGTYTARLRVTFDEDVVAENTLTVTVTSAAATPLVRLTSDPTEDTQPAWSPDGTQVVFRSTRSGNQDLWIVPRTGGVPVQLTTDTAADASPAWSPDGTTIAFASFRGGNWDIWTIPAAGGTATQVTTNAAADEEPAWSPDGTELAFRSNRLGAGDIWKIPAAGGTAVQLTTNPAFDIQPAWSPDGTWILFQSRRSLGHWEIWRVGADGTGVSRVTPSAASNPGDRQPRWAPDGSEFVFASTRDTSLKIWRSPFPSGAPVRLTDGDGDDEYPAWSPDGRFVVFASDREGAAFADLWILELSTTRQPSTSGSPIAASP